MEKPIPNRVFHSEWVGPFRNASLTVSAIPNALPIPNRKTYSGMTPVIRNPALVVIPRPSALSTAVFAGEGDYSIFY
jgi:hypothetical protein